MNYRDELHLRLKNLILNTCNTIGCKDCGLNYEGGCSATDLQDRIYKEEKALDIRENVK